MHHQLFHGQEPVSLEQIELDTTISEQLGSLQMSTDILYNFILYNTLIKAFNLSIVNPVDIQTMQILYSLKPKEINYTSLSINILDDSVQLEENLYFVFFTPSDEFLSSPITTGLIIQHDEDFKINIIGSGLFIGDEENSLRGAFNFNINQQDYQGKLKFTLNHQEKTFSFLVESLNENLTIEVDEVYPGSMFLSILNHLKNGDLVTAQAEIDEYDVGNYPYILESNFSENGTLPLSIPLKPTGETNLLYCDAKNRDRTEYGSLIEALTNNYSFSCKDEFYSFACVNLKVIEVLTIDGRELKLYMAVFTPSYIPDFEDTYNDETLRAELLSLLGDQAQTTEIYYAEQMTHQSRIFACENDNWYLVGAGTGITLLNDTDNNHPPYEGAAGFAINGQEYYMTYNHQEINLHAIEDTLIDIYDSFDVFINYNDLAKKYPAPAVTENDLQLVSTIENSKNSFPIAFDVPKPSTQLPFCGLDHLENGSDVIALYEHLSTSYSYYQNNEYYAPVWIKLQMMSILDNNLHEPFEAFLAVFSPIGETSELEVITDEIEEYEDDEDYRDDISAMVRLIVKRNDQFYIVGHGEAAIDKYTQEYYGDGECIIDGHHYDFNFSTDQFYFVEERANQKDRLFYTQPVDISIDYQQVKAIERQRGYRDQ